MDDINLKQTEAGVELHVKASPGSRKNEIRGVIDGAIKVCVTTVAEKGKANKAIIALLSKQLKVPKSRFELISGTTSSRKKFLIVGARISDVRENLIRLLG